MTSIRHLEKEEHSGRLRGTLRWGDEGDGLMRFLSARDVTMGTSWEAVDVADIDGATVRLHWTDSPYVWHVNDGPEVFVVLDGVIDMHHRRGGRVTVQQMVSGDVCHAEPGDEHVAHPAGVARVLVVERKGSV